MESTNKDFYLAPAVSIVEVKTEGIICTSRDDYEQRTW